ncbi:DegT/DnrJ/EryC1/StrS family aminotransferase [Paenibacillus koleovorans]|uniref:DegT/DnrJ/EryC1/StrS family aminotransferase n=1 Tax=Paenibacillus koleovorans TaxID=121608 RepID=UPI000FD7B126|nr:DegT/DnrJ/EryC1/StrS family aminotransferase [Paenibacillus koleovorans]
MKIPYALPYIDDQEIAELISTLKSNWLSRGPKTAEFESKFADYVDSEYAVGLNSCTAGLHLAQLALGIGPGDEVITTPYTFVATANTILHTGAKPVFCDIDPITMNIDHTKLEKHITANTKAIIPVHFAGLPCEMDTIMDMAKSNNFKVIEDAAHAVYTRYKKEPIGCIGDMTCFSFYTTKNLATGEGGMVTTKDEELADRLRVMSLHGMDRNAWNRYTEKGSWFYEVIYPGYKYNMTDIQAALGLVQLTKLEEMQSLRNKYSEMYQKAFSNQELITTPFDSSEHTHAWHLYVLRIDFEKLFITRSEFIEILKDKGIGTSVHFIPVPKHPYYKKLGYSIEDYPNASKAYEEAVSIPLYPSLSEEQVNYIIEMILTTVNNSKR